jgi:PPP family 3-phenylpropionic acid transporter
VPGAQSALPSPHARLAAFYFFYFASVGAFLPFWGLYLEALGFGPTQIGQLMAVTMATKVIAPIMWGWMGDSIGRRISIVRVASLLALVIFSAALAVSAYWRMLLVLGGFSFFWNAALPQFEATTLDHLDDGVHHYSRIRLWGSVGFIVTVMSLGPFLQRFGIEWLPVIVFVLLATIWINTLLVPENEALRPQTPQSLRTTLRHPTVIALLLACFLLQASHGAYYSFFSIYMAEHGYSSGAIGGLWALGVMAEVGVFMRMSRWLPRFGSRALLLTALILAAVRWLLIAVVPEQLSLMLLAQLLHAASFGLSHAAAMDMVYRLFPGRLQGRGQALYSSLSFGLGGAVGSLLSGYAWSAVGSQWCFVAAAVIAVVGALVAARGLWSRLTDAPVPP